MLVGRRRPAATSGLGAHVLVAVAHPTTAVPLCQLATALALPERGRVTAITVAPLAHVEEERAAAQDTLASCEVAVADEGLAAAGKLRVDTSVADGILNGAVEYEASSVVLGWPSADGGRLAVPPGDLLGRARVPVLLARLGGYRWDRIVLRPVTGDDPGSGSLQVARETAERLGRRYGVPVVTAGATPASGTAVELVVVPYAPGRSLDELAGTVAHDLVVAVAGRASGPSDTVTQQHQGRHPSR